MRPWLASALAPFMPPVRALRTYEARFLPRDLLAGLTVSVVDLPQSMAFALIAGVPPVYGLYTAIVLAFFGALFTSSRFLSVGPTNTQSLLVASIVSRVYEVHDLHFVYLVIALTLVKGVLQLAFAAARMGRLVRFVSGSIMVGFTAGAGVLILVEQVPGFLGFSVEHTPTALPGVLGAVERWAAHLSDIDPRSVAIGIGSLVVVIALRLKWRHAPGPLLAVAGGAVLVWAMGWTDSGMRLVGALPRGLPHFQVPRIGFGVAPERVEWRELEALLTGALALAVLGMLESVAIAKSIAVRTGQRISANQEFFGQGFANVVGSFFLCIPGSGSFSRTALQYDVGAQTRLASVFCAIFNAAFFIALAPLARFIPLAALAAILFVVAAGLIDVRALRRLAQTSQAELAVAVATFLSALFVPLAYAIYVGIFLSLALYLRHAGTLRGVEIVLRDGGRFVERGIDVKSLARERLVLQLSGDLFFGVADELADRLTEVARGDARVVVLRLKRTHLIDATVLGVLSRFVKDMHAEGRYVILCGVHAAVMKPLVGYGLYDEIGAENVFETRDSLLEGTKRALARADALLAEMPPSESEEPVGRRRAGRAEPGALLIIARAGHSAGAGSPAGATRRSSFAGRRVARSH